MIVYYSLVYYIILYSKSVYCSLILHLHTRPQRSASETNESASKLSPQAVGFAFSHELRLLSLLLLLLFIIVVIIVTIIIIIMVRYAMI